ncbi:hypothetical protein B484DRAFT_444736 [Ochromonadaceae sp. CCMP2298]|jgi:hypothetical protein|nr:hypothetical protein B484DRAFT_444736 [Ochromonadaceae sp. CCMP2298]
MAEKDAKTDNLSPELLGFNNLQLDKFQTVLYIAAGIISGVLGLTGVHGLIMFVAAWVAASGAILLKMGFNLPKYTNNNLIGLSTGGITNFVMSYVLFWTLAYALVHIY